MSLSPARQHRLRVQAEQAAREGGSVRHASGYDLMLLQLAEDRRRLKGVQSTVKKAEIKVELLPKYAAWAEGVLAEGLSVAGPTAAYEFHARSADGRVADASATSPAPAEVVLTVLSREGDGTAEKDLLDVVEKALNSENVRPVADRLTVRSAEIIPYRVEATIFLYPGPEAEPVCGVNLCGVMMTDVVLTLLRLCSAGLLMSSKHISIPSLDRVVPSGITPFLASSQASKQFIPMVLTSLMAQ
ncbi:TPA: baseplate J/gp47 family protein [Escherichia coli]|nr:baseplate J/gp47 family protein [Escherichia coli]HCO0839678.1 baseplate J/gp47 family protein [Escherichia coli]